MELQNDKLNEEKNERNALLCAREQLLALREEEKMKRDEIELVERQIKEIN